MADALEPLRLARDYAWLKLKLPSAAPLSERPLNKILILGYAAVGDMVFMLPALKALREGLPKAKLVFVGDDDLGNRALLPNTALVDEIWRYTHPRIATLAAREELEQRIKAESFDAVVVTLGTPLRPFARAILSIPIRIGQIRPHLNFKQSLIASEFERRWVLNHALPVQPEEEHMAERHLELVDALGLPVPEARLARPDLPRSTEADAFADDELPRDPKRPTIALHLGPPNNQYFKMWPPERWAELAQLLAKEYDARFVLVGGDTEGPSLSTFRVKYSGPFIDYVGRLPLLHSIAILRKCDLSVSADTGIAKLAMAAGVPTSTIWGPTSRADNGILWDPEFHQDIVYPMPCAPCVSLGMRREGPGVLHYDACGHRDCLGKLTALHAFNEIKAKHGRRLKR